MDPERQYARQVTRIVLRWYYEHDDGVISHAGSSAFDVRLLNYHMDVDKALTKVHPSLRHWLELVHKDGVGVTDAASIVGISTEHPRQQFADLEARIGQLLVSSDVANILTYFT